MDNLIGKWILHLIKRNGWRAGFQSCDSFSYDEGTSKVKCTGNVMLKLYKRDMVQ